MRRGGTLGRGAGRKLSIRENRAQIGTPTYRSTARWNEISNVVLNHAATFMAIMRASQQVELSEVTE
jgi:hypothetical protein